MEVALDNTGRADLQSNEIPTAPLIPFGGHFLKKHGGKWQLGTSCRGVIPSRARAGVPAGDRLNAGASGFAHTVFGAHATT